MALRIIEGVPGAGKTFYAVWHLAKNYFKKVPGYTRLQEFFYFIFAFLRPPVEQKYVLDRDCLIITNIDNFQPDHISLNEEIKKAGQSARDALLNDHSLNDRERDRKLDQLNPVAEFFSKPYQKEYKEGKSQIVYVIDEAQTYFRKGMDRILKERLVFDYFEWHRHWGQDIYLVTQNIKKLPPDLVHLVEYTISAVPRVRSIGPGFRYHWMASGERIKTEVRRPDQAVFALYKSMDVAEQEKIKNPVLFTVGLAFLAAFAVLAYGFIYITDRFGSGDVEPVPSSSVASSSVASVSSPYSGDSYIPIGDPERFKSPPAPPAPRYVVFLPLRKFTTLSGKIIHTKYLWRGQFIPAKDFPHKVVRIGRRPYVVLDYELFDFIFSHDEDRPTDFIVQVAEPEKETEPGAGANDRSAARSDLSGGPARKGA